MKIANFDTDHHVFIVAEIGNNHEGSFTLAEELVGRAAEAGVDGVKLQTFIPERYVTSTDRERLERLHRFQLSVDQIRKLSKQAEEAGTVLFSTPFDIESARVLNAIQPVFKISSGDNTFFPLIETVAEFRKPTMISTGLAGMELIERIHLFWRERAGNTDLALLHCVASYPTPIEEANLGAIASLKSHFPDVTIGYSDHTLGIEAAGYAVAAGARIVEKHFTIDKNYSDFRDHKLSAEPVEMGELVAQIRSISVMMNDGEVGPQSCEEELQIGSRRSIAAARDMAAGTVLTEADLTWVRPGIGIPPEEENQLLKRRLIRTIKDGELIQLDDVE